MVDYSKGFGHTDEARHTMSALGQKQTFASRHGDVRFTPKSGHVQCGLVCPLSAKSGRRPGTIRCDDLTSSTSHILQVLSNNDFLGLYSLSSTNQPLRGSV